MKDISDLISQVGFPIVVSLLMIYQQEKMSSSYIDIVESLKDLISDNTKAINLLISRAKENDDKMIQVMKNQVGAVANENNQEASSTVSNNQ